MIDRQCPALTGEATTGVDIMTTKTSRPARKAAADTSAETPVPQSLGDPLTLPNGQVLPNRIMKSALSEALADQRNAPDHRLVQLFRTWGQGGFGLVITGNVMVDRRQLGEPGNVVIEDERDLEALTRWAAATKDAGIPTWVQLNHPGRQSNLLALGHTPVAPSPIPLNLPGAAVPRELTAAEIEEIIDRFATAAAVCEKAGFAGVQVHGAHGYLVSQFLSPLTNKRTDEWGGDAERRMRFVLEVVRRIRARVSSGFAVGIKLNSADFQRGGFTEDESRAVLVALAGEGIDLIEVTGGSYESPAMAGSAAESTRAREAYFLDYARTVRDLVGDIPVAVTGGFRTHAAMDQAIGAGECDVVGIGRPTATTPDAADVLLSGRADAVVAHQLRAGMRRVLGRVTDLKTLDGFLDLGWHQDQLHRMGAGLEPDPDRGALATTISLVRRNGRASFRRKRGH
jgi:2,4-dienoyl-CoA reductase-like NADH-dependent reductase (Old Yellow Enzyme family)